MPCPQYDNTELSLLVLLHEIQISKFNTQRYSLGDWKGFERLSPHCDQVF